MVTMATERRAVDKRTGTVEFDGRWPLNNGIQEAVDDNVVYKSQAEIDEILAKTEDADCTHG